ncbi:MAG: ribonuclease H-like domain-containing protein [Lachnospiraceae bacterium]|nr:ribonuclease H-like domain-containing protein [Lachnospiraceae bacterium]
MFHDVQTLNREECRLIEDGMLQAVLMCEASELNEKDCLFFDIETTGFSADTSFIFLIGCICYDGNKWVFHQFIIRLVQEERQLISSFYELALQYHCLIHFNGTAFDLPFLRKRSVTNLLKYPFDSFSSVDLYQRYRPMKDKLGLSHMNQRSLENYTGWMRKDQLSGKEITSLFWEYTTSMGPELEKLLLLHNQDDLRGMLHVLKLEACHTLSKGRILPGSTTIISEDYCCLQIQFTTILPLFHPLYFSDEKSSNDELLQNVCTNNNCITVYINGRSGQLKIPFFCGTLKYFFPDYKNYYYLPIEKQAIHKSIAAYVEKEYRVAARPENCFAEKSGHFLPQPEAFFSPSFRESYESKMQFFEYEVNLCGQQSENLAAYTEIMLRTILNTSK